MSDSSVASTRRWFVFTGVALITAASTAELAGLLSVKGHTALEYLLLLLFAINVSWVALAFWTGWAGFIARMFHLRMPGLKWPEPQDRTLASKVAVLMPVHNEDPREVIAHLEAIQASLERTGQSAQFDFFILSDTTQAERWVEEEQEWAALCERLGGRGRVHYRKRSDNLHKKSGNIADFCRRWGADYPFFVVLDADSLMTGESLVSLTRLMELNPGAGILQAPPVLVGRGTPFARLQQFAAFAYGRLNASGLAWWQLGDSNYWGHNAIIRTAAFAAHCGLPVLPGRKPFGGEILSHDFVEAALIRRAGYSVWLVPEVEGSYEQPPPTLLDYAQRDRRWCQGNLQHIPLIASEGLHPMSRLHFGMGAMSYLAAPLWLLFLAVGLAAAIHDRWVDPVYFGSERSLFPLWPTFDRARAIQLAFLSFGMLLTPKLLGVLEILIKGQPRGSRLRTAFSALTEMLWSAVTAPIHMLLQTGFVLGALTGRSVSWGAQQRDDRRTAWSEAFRRHAVHTILGAWVAVMGLVVLPDLGPWLATLSLGLLLSAPLSVASSSVALGRFFGRRRLWETQEQVDPSDVVSAAEVLKAEAAQRPPAKGVEAVLQEPMLHALHLSLLSNEAAPPRALSLVLASARHKVETEGLAALSPAEKNALLSHPQTLKELHHAHLMRQSSASR